ncbi:phosphatases II [Polychaeton citri CBS 116435]|uniref:protein-tyrosine-phosphatase n=1 Tax=Polychaeton citri CBS 116435 TaxID=1314669 RepID=A0A9P4Q8E4_9PEZI|nr:phosphatases II [Polychaeton citri CBS 116435]
MPHSRSMTASATPTRLAPEQPAHIEHAQAFGQVIEYIEDRLYLASYTHPPTDDTPFPYQRKNASPRKSRHKASASVPPKPTDSRPPAYFTVDPHFTPNALLYNAFHADFGPLHIGHLYRFAVQLHDVLGAEENDGRKVVFYSSADSRSRANAACLLAVYMVLIQSWPPHLALGPISQMDPPVMMFRDAGYSQADYTLSVQDIVYGVWRAKEEGLLSLKDFSLEEYERFERVDQGDFNWVTPPPGPVPSSSGMMHASFLAFASPQHPLPPSHSDLTVGDMLSDTTLPKPFRNVLAYFHYQNIGLVVRLNSKLYEEGWFEALDIKHTGETMVFDDGTCPPLHFVKRFIAMSNDMFSKGCGIAVHCKAGLGRTGCLIGAYLIYRYGFTANECISFMRFMRPGMVVGPQQHWLHLNQGTFREWFFEDNVRSNLESEIRAKLREEIKLEMSANLSTPKKRVKSGQILTPGSGGRKALGEIRPNSFTSDTTVYAPLEDTKDFKKFLGVHDENLPAPTPGQPRKTSKAFGMSTRRPTAPAMSPLRQQHPDQETVTMTRTSYPLHSETDDTDAENALKTAKSPSASAQRRLGSHSPLSRSGKRRAVSCTTTTVSTTKWDVGSANNTDVSDNENVNPVASTNDLVREMGLLDHISSPTKAPKTPGQQRKISGSGVGSLSVSKRSSPVRKSTEGKTSVRKTSGRIGSMNMQQQRAASSRAA